MPANTTTQNSETQNVQTPKKQRFFKCMYNNETKGRYSGYKPKQAANKALTSIIKDTVTNNGKNPDSINGQKFTFEMIECTRGGKRKISLYEGERVKLPKPLEVVIKKNGENKKITYNYQNKLHKIKEDAKKNEEVNPEGSEEKVAQTEGKAKKNVDKKNKSKKDKSTPKKEKKLADKKEKKEKVEKTEDKKEKKDKPAKKEKVVSETKTKSEKKESEDTSNKKEKTVKKEKNESKTKSDKKDVKEVKQKTDKKETKKSVKK